MGIEDYASQRMEPCSSEVQSHLDYAHAIPVDRTRKTCDDVMSPFSYPTFRFISDLTY